MEGPGRVIAPQRIKCLVLGAADSGKTSFLRRYFRNTFHYGERVPTLGTDFYSARVKNPFYRGGRIEDHGGYDNNDGEIENEGESETEEEEEEGAGRDQEDDEEDDDREDEEGHHSEVNSEDDDHSHYEQVGQHDNRKVDPNYSESTESYYEVEPTIIDPNHPIAQHSFVLLQMWDTPGTERIPMGTKDQNQSSCDASTLSHSFFCKIDAAVLVYDINSSTSFTHLLQWHEDLLQITKRINGKTNLPVLIVANKLDMYCTRKDREWTWSSNPSVRPSRRRDIMGLKGNFRGKDLPYEYRVLTATPLQQQEEQQKYSTNKSRSGFRNRRGSNNHYETSTFMSTITGDGTWANDDDIYLNSLLNSEDGCHPDLHLVLLWCKRNGLQHAEVSALDGTGVNDAIDKLVRLTLESRMEHNTNNELPIVETQATVEPPATQTPAIYNMDFFRPNEELDLSKRYAPEQSRCFRLLPPIFHKCKLCK